MILFSFFSCEGVEELSMEAERAKILALHHTQRDHHFGKDSVAFAHQLSDHFISVNRGVVSQPTRAETIARYNKYFSAVEFVKWDDLSEPIIRFSEDYSLAYTIVRKIVVVEYKIDIDSTIFDSTHFAWTAIYKRYGEEWKIDCVTSTEQ